ncbi:acetyltransferase [Desulfoscipio geothermicus]|uniref:Sugar O-acyltransferase, sialic acid O-acetyltransferase NeuD family n=1 Tax=Desulfoscipio geothermicus DSM 3669 TaxID=1121426 RepID=A0A1I6CUY2_9FIRM|nr:acetyltransferase [Desulfoscipio geothermicus]SFQ96911.1 sugar O-acyltransferase, sialic acid O-acetyltransferase NeuD family [Desulfoscipio geothermicus DSM 3669]
MPPGEIVTAGETKIPIVIIGAGGHAAVIADIIQKQGRYGIIGYTAPRERSPAASWGYNYLGDDSILPNLLQKDITLVALGVGGTGDNRPRSQLYEQIRALGFSFPVLSHPTAIVSGNVILGNGTVIAPGAVVNPGVETGKNVIINSGAVIEHDSSIGDHVHVAPGTVICGDVRVGRLAHVGAGAVIIQRVKIGEGAIIGAGAVVLRDVEPWTVVAGNPARVIRELEE